ncbi:unnamed protein product [Amoebophrya sp. A25]|nr:unnamed protein product [Amoebophrya sp. A25]|eukprot:GSA25T00017071001.1
MADLTANNSGPAYMAKVRAALAAAREGDVPKLRELLGEEEQLQKLGDDWATLKLLSPNVRDNRWRTLLMYATTFGQKATVKYLLSHPGIQPNLRDDSQMTVLHHACRKTTAAMKLIKHNSSQADLVRTLIKSGCSINVQDSYGATPLMYAVSFMDRVISYTLLYHDADLFLQDFQGGDCMTYAGHNQDLKLGCMLYHAGLQCPDTEFGNQLCEYIDELGGEAGSASEGEDYLDEDDASDNEGKNTSNFQVEMLQGNDDPDDYDLESGKEDDSGPESETRTPRSHVKASSNPSSEAS